MISLSNFVHFQSRNGLIYSLSHQFPTLCACLGMMDAGKDKCLICKEKGRKTFIKCDEEDCNFMYCPDCWRDIDVSEFLCCFH